MRALSLIVCLLLAACATPRAACLSAATRDLATLDRLIAETEANLSRGYAIRQEPYVTTGIELCVGTQSTGAVNVGLRYCNTSETQYRDTPVAFDPAAERRKLAQLRTSRAKAAARAAEAQSACLAKYPES